MNTTSIDQQTPAFAIKLLRAMYVQQGFAFDARLGEVISSEFASDLNISPNGALFIFLDEIIDVYHRIKLILFGVKEQQIPEALFHLSFVVVIFQYLVAIRLMLSNDLDLQARVMLRHLLETIEQWVALSDNMDLLPEYRALTSIDQAQQFWHRYFSKDKLKKAILRRSDQLQLSAAMHDEFFSNHRAILGAAIHSNKIGLDANLRTFWNNMENQDKIIMGTTRTASRFSLGLCILMAAIPFDVLSRLDLELHPELASMILPAHKSISDWLLVFRELVKIPGYIALIAHEWTKRNLTTLGEEA